MRALSQLKIKYSCHAHNRAPTVSAFLPKLQETKKAMMVETGRTRGRRTKGDTTMKLCSTEPGMMEDEETPLPVLHISNTARLLPHLRTESLTAVQHPMSVIHSPVSYVSVVRARGTMESSRALRPSGLDVVGETKYGFTIHPARTNTRRQVPLLRRELFLRPLANPTLWKRKSRERS